MLRAFITGVLARDHQPDAPCSCWPGGERTWIIAVDYDTGWLAVFGRPGAPRVAFPDAVATARGGTQVTVLTPGQTTWPPWAAT